jgi:hypothetical protein
VEKLHFPITRAIFMTFCIFPHGFETIIKFCFFGTPIQKEKMTLFIIFGNFEAKFSQNSPKWKSTLYKRVLDFHFTTIQGLALVVIFIAQYITILSSYTFLHTYVQKVQ